MVHRNKYLENMKKYQERFDVDEWSYIAKAVGKLIQEIKKLKQ
jgi:hypothetical protein